MTDLPTTVTNATAGHDEHHALLKADYDARHPNAPLPDLPPRGRFYPIHMRIHELLNSDCNEQSGTSLPADIQDSTPHHNEHHGILHAAYNDRRGSGWRSLP